MLGIFVAPGHGEGTNRVAVFGEMKTSIVAKPVVEDVAEDGGGDIDCARRSRTDRDEERRRGLRSPR